MGEIIIEEVLPKGPPGSSSELQYIVVSIPPYSPHFDEGGRGIHDYHICCEMTTYWRSGVSSWPDEKENNYIRLPEINLTSEQNKVILCRNRTIFENYYGVAGDVPVFDWRFLSGFGENAGSKPRNVRLNPDGDILLIKRQWGGTPTIVFDVVAWGDTSLFEFWKAKDGNDTDNRDQWNDPHTVPAAPAGHSIRRLSPESGDSDTHTDWYHEANPIPAQNPQAADEVWIDIELPLFSVNSTQPLTPTWPNTGEWLPLNDSAPLDPSGVIQIDIEQIQYTESNADGIKIAQRGINGTLASSHPVTSLIRLVDPQSGEAHRRYSISSIECKRRAIINEKGIIVVPTQIAAWGSIEKSPLFPGDSDYRTSWLGHGAFYSATNPNSDTTISIPVLGRRLQHIMLRFGPMSDGGRVKLNDVYAWMNSGINQSGTSGVGGIFRELLLNVLEDHEFDIVALDQTRADQLVNEGNLGQVLNDLLAENACIMRYTHDGRVRIERHQNHPLAEPPPVKAILDARAIRNPHNTTYVSRLASQQIIVEIFDPTTNEYYEAKYPPRTTMSAKRINLRLAISNASQAAMIAEMLYRQNEKILRKYTATTVGPAPWLRVGDRVLVRDVSDQSIDGGSLLQCRVTSITRGGESNTESIELMEWHG
ncbi:MAG: hypothetical protein ACPGWR_00995 [Ardenticatenaceae bacterium]